MATVRELRPGDEEALERLLVQFADTSMFLRNNWRGGGLAPGTERLQGTWAGAFEGDEMVAVGAHFWNGNVMVEAPEHLEEVARAAVRGSGRPVAGLVGTPSQCRAMRTLFGLDQAPAYLESVEDLFSLELARLHVPAALASGSVRCRCARSADVDTVVAWRVAYSQEALGLPDTRELREATAAAVPRQVETGDLYVLEKDEVLVSMTAWNARIEDCVQVGGVWTPPELRSNGYARCAVAGSLLDVRPEGVTRSILFTPEENHAARACYLGLGYEIVGKYCIVLFDRPQTVSV